MKKYFLNFSIIFLLSLVLIVGASAKTVFVSDGARGDGTSAATPFGSLTDAYTALGSDGGEIVLVGNVTLPLNKGGTTRTAFVEPAHSGKVTIRGYDENAVMLFANPYEYHMSGETEFKNFTISSGAYTSGLNICARGYHLTMGEGLTMHSTGEVSGQVGTKIYLHGGCLPNATVDGYLDCDNHLTVNSGTYWGIFGFNRSLNVTTTGKSVMEVGGNVNTYYIIAGSSGGSSFVAPSSSEIYIIGDLTVVQQISLGNQNSDVSSFDSNLILLYGELTFSKKTIDYNARKRLTTLDIYYNDASDDAKATYETYFKGYGDREGTLEAYCVNELGGHAYSGGKCTKCEAAQVIVNADIIYVSDGGNGNGSSAVSPLGSLTDAYTALGSDGGEIVLVGNVTLPLNKGGTTRTAFVEPAHSGKVTIRGYDENAVMLFANPYEYHMSGETEFKNFTISSGAYTSGLNICARGYHLTMGEGLTMHSTGEVSGQVGTKIYLHGGCLPSATVSGYLDCDNHLTVKSGTYWCIIGFNRNINTNIPGKSVIEVGGDVSTHYLIAGSSGTCNFIAPASAEVYIIGDLTVTQQISLGNQNSDVDSFDSNLIIKNGTVNFVGELIDYNERSKLTTLDIYVDETSISAISTYSLLFAGYGDREGALKDYCVNELGTHIFEQDVCLNCGIAKAVAECTSHSFKATAEETILSNICENCGFTAKLTTKTEGTTGVYTYTSGNLRVQVLSDSIVRIEESKDGTFVDQNTLVVPARDAFEGTTVVYDEDGDTVILSTDSFVVNIPKENATTSSVRIFNKEGNTLYSYFENEKRSFYSSLPEPANTPNSVVYMDNGIIPAEGGLTYNGSTDEKSGWSRSENVDVYVLVTHGDSIKLRKEFVELTGRTEMSDIKTLGSWYSKWTNYTAEEKLAMLALYREKKLPLDMMVIDTEWKNTSVGGNGGSGTGYDLNTELYPDMTGFLKAAEEMGTLVLFNDHTHQTTLKITNPEELKWQSEGINSLMQIGLDGWWYDRNWSYSLKSPYSDVLYSTIGQVLYNDTMAKYHADTKDGDYQKRVLLLSNVDWIRHGHITGNPSVIGHRYGIQWTGDINSDVLQLRREIENMVIGGTNGASPYISSDLGGFFNVGAVSTNQFIRWMQYGTLSPVTRVHSTLSAPNEQFPWSYGEAAEKIVGNYLNMRYHLMPYYYMLARENYDTGMPLMRRLDFYYPQYEEAKDNTQYLIGEDILVAPFWSTSGEGSEAVPAEWLKTPTGEAGLYTEYFNIASGIESDAYFAGTPTLTETVKNIDNYWYTGSPNVKINADYFTVRYTGTITPEYDCYIGVLADDGARIYINGELWTNGYNISPVLTPCINTSKALKAGTTYDLRIEYYEKTGQVHLYFVCENVLPENTSERTVFIPDGAWINMFSGEEVVGPKTITVRGGMAETPIFVRKGAAIPTSKVISPMTGADWSEVSVNIYGLADTSFTLYEDDGKTEGYKDNKFRNTEFSVKAVANDVWQINIGASEGDFATEYASRKIKLRIHSDLPITAVSVNGEAATVTYIKRDSYALPFANSGASNISDVYEIEFDAMLDNEYTVSLDTTEKPELILGDVDGDGSVTIKDVLDLIHGVLNDRTVENGDVNGDGKVGLADALCVLKLVADA